MIDVLDALERWRAEGQRIAVATVVGVEQSAPRDPGAMLAVNERERTERSRERLYVGLSRGRDQLVVCGDPDYVREVGGEALFRSLKG